MERKDVDASVSEVVNSLELCPEYVIYERVSGGDVCAKRRRLSLVPSLEPPKMDAISDGSELRSSPCNHSLTAFSARLSVNSAAA